jgi:hypothetical protein
MELEGRAPSRPACRGLQAPCLSPIPGPEGPRRLPPEGGTPTRQFTSPDLPVGVPASAGSRSGALAPSLA